MKKIKMETVMGILLLAAAFLLTTGGIRQASSSQVQNTEHTVVIDAGHGGSRMRRIATKSL